MARRLARGSAGPAARELARLAVLVLAGGTALSLHAHEYWLDPLDATPDADGRLFAQVRNGQDFVGTGFPYDPRRMSRLDLVGPTGSSPLAARLGDMPAVQAELDGAGTFLVVLDTFGKALVYDDLEAFDTFLAYHGLSGFLAAHAERGLPERDILEIYFRHVKTLVQAGETGEGGANGPRDHAAFAAQDQRLELVPLNDPYVGTQAEIELLLDGEPLGDAQVELFERTPAPDGAVSRIVARTDAAGRVTFDVGRPGDYLVNAVQVFEPGEEARALEGPAPHWESRWASLTFERP